MVTLNLGFFRTFVRVMEILNLSKAAEELGLSQPAVTKQIQALEEKFGTLLLERSGKRLKPTEAGVVLYRYACEMLKLMEKTEEAMDEISTSSRGVLHLGASTIPANYILPQYIKNFKEMYPQVTVSMEVADTWRVFYRVAGRELDLGIVGAWFEERGVEGFRWLDDELVVILPENHRLAGQQEVRLESLVTERWILREKGSGTRAAVEEMFKREGIATEKLMVQAEMGSTEAVVAAVEAGLGIAVVSRLALREKMDQGKMKWVKIAGKVGTRGIYVIYPKQKYRRRAVENFIAFLREEQGMMQS